MDRKRQGGGGQGGYQQPNSNWKSNNQYQNNNNNYRSGGDGGGGGRGGYRGGPQKSYAAPSNRTQINLITNNFKIRSKKEQGVIYTYKVDFLEGSGPGGVSGGAGFEGSTSMESSEQLNNSMSMMSLSKGQSSGGGGNLETFQKFRIMNSHKE